MAQANIGIIISAIDKATGPFQKAGRSVEAFQKRIEKSAAASRRFALGMTAVGVAVGGLGYKMISAAADMEQTKIAFETMLGSGQAADKFIRDLTDFAKRTPFEMKGLEDASKKLLAFGIESKNVIPDLKSLGDIAAGVGSEKLPFLINAFGQVRAKGRLMGQELLQFTEAGVPLAEELAKSFGKTTAEIQDMISKGQVGFEDVRNALKNLTGESGRFNNLMDKQADSLKGMVSNLSDAWDIFLRGEGAALIDWSKKFVQAATNIVQNVLPEWIAKIKAMITFFQEHTTVLYIVAGAIMGALVPAVMSAAASFAALAISLAPFLLAGAIVGGIVAGIVWIVKNWDMLKKKAIAIWGAIKDFIVKAVTFLIDTQMAKWKLLAQAVKVIWNAIKSAVSAAINYLTDKLRPFIKMAERAIALAKRASSFVGGAAKSAWSGAKSLVGLAEGGIVTKPTLAMIGEGNEPEAVVPLSKLAGVGAGGGPQIVITGNTFYSTDDAADELARILQDKLGLRMRGASA